MCYAFCMNINPIAAKTVSMILNIIFVLPILPLFLDFESFDLFGGLFYSPPLVVAAVFLVPFIRLRNEDVTFKKFLISICSIPVQVIIYTLYILLLLELGIGV